jgi:hypothetical protein
VTSILATFDAEFIDAFLDRKRLLLHNAPFFAQADGLHSDPQRRTGM